MTFVFASHSPFDEFLVVGSHHLAPTLAEAGHQVWHLGPPVTPLHLMMPGRTKYRSRLLNARRGATQRQPNLISIDPFALVPWQVARHLLSFGNWFVRGSNIESTLKGAGCPDSIDVLLIDDPRSSGLERLLKPRSVYYRATDLYSELKSDSSLVKAERQLLDVATGVLATSQPVLEHLRNLRPGLPSLLLENGVDWKHFATPCGEAEELKTIPHPRVIYVGVIDFRFDLDLLGHLAAKQPHVHFVIIGEGQLKELRALQKKNIHVLGPRPYRLLPGFLQHADAGLLPFVDNRVNAGRSPLKLYEFGAAGLPVLARQTEELSRRGDDFVQLYHSGDEAVDRLAHLLETPADRKRISESCKVHAWTRKASALVEFIQETGFQAKVVGRDPIAA